MVGYTCWQVFVSVTITLEDPVHIYTGNLFCHTIYFVISLGVIHGLIGGFGIAVMRILFIKFPSRVSLGKKSTALLISWATMMTSIGVSYLWVVSPKVTIDIPSICMGRSADLQRTLFYYSSDKYWIYEKRILSFGLLGFGIMFVLAELGIYASIYQYLFHHDKTMELVLSQDLVKKRQKKNVITLAGHSLAFVLETSFLVLGISAHTIPPSYFWIVRLAGMSTYGLLSAVHVTLSSTLRADCMEWFSSLSQLLVVPWMRIKYQIYTGRRGS